jgi:UDP-glucose/iron transport system ATP-binding protein
MIEIENIDLLVSGKSILRDVSLSVKRGDKAALFGESGSGKTSLLRALIGLHRIESGRICIDGLEVLPENIEAIRKNICYIPQQVEVFDEETAEQFITFPLKFKANRQKGFEKKRIVELLEKLKLDRKQLDNRMTDLSGGERQRMAVVRGLMLGRSILLLDEVTSAVDRENRERVIEAVFEQRDVTVLAVTHDRLWLEKSTPAIEIDQGRIVTG